MGRYSEKINSAAKLGSGVSLLLISNLLVKVIGVFFKIPIVGIIGDEGMGYFNAAYTVYTLFFTLSTSGLPVAVSILISKCIAENKPGDKRLIYKVTLKTFLLIGFAGSVFMLFGCRGLAYAIGSEKAYLSIAAMSFVLLFVCISSAMRGYFQGHQNMLPTAISQLIESFGKLTVGIVLALYASCNGYSKHVVAAFAVLGITVSSAVAMLYLVFVKNSWDKWEQKARSAATTTAKRIFAKLFSVAIPITVSSAVMSLTNILDLSMVMRRLVSIGYSQEAATAVYGNYSGLAVPMFNLPSAAIAPIALSIVPYITSARAKNDISLASQTVVSAIKCTAILSFPCSFGISVMSLPILKLIFNDIQAQKAAPLLSVLAAAIITVGLTTVTTALLQSYGRNYYPLISMLFGSVVKLISGYFLIGHFGMLGTPVSTVLCYLVTTVINFVFLKKCTGLKIHPLKLFFKPAFASLLSCGLGYGLFSLICGIVMEEICCVMAIGVTGLVYFSLILLMKGMDKNDARIFPGGNFIERYFLRGT